MGQDDIQPPAVGRTRLGRRALIVGAVSVGGGIGAWLALQHEGSKGGSPSNESPAGSLSGSAQRPRPTRSSRGLVRSMGASGNGRSDDSNAFRAALEAFEEVVVSKGDYLVSFDQHGNAMTLDQPGTRLTFERGAALHLAPSMSSTGAVIRISASDCAISGGTIVGDLLPLVTGRMGEWAHGIVVDAGGHRANLDNVAVIRCWGDGIYIGGGAQDVVLTGVTCDSNRRQGLSITGATRPRVLGGRFTNTGAIEWTAPAAGIDVEPNTAESGVLEAFIQGAVINGNRGNGVLFEGSSGPVLASLAGCTVASNGEAGVLVRGSGCAVSLANVTSTANTVGFVVSETTRGTLLADCNASSSIADGFDISGPITTIVTCRAESNGRSGFLLTQPATGSRMAGGSARANGRSVTSPQIDVYASGASIIGVSSEGGVDRPPASGFTLRASATDTVLVDVTTPGPFGMAPIIDLRRPTTAGGSP